MTEPSTEAWDGFGHAMSSAPELALVAIAIVVAFVVFARWVMPTIKDMRKATLDSKERVAMSKIQVEREEIEAKNRQSAAFETLTEVVRDAKSKVDSTSNEMTAFGARIEESKVRSHEMSNEVYRTGKNVDHIGTRVDHINDRVDEIHDLLVEQSEKEE